MAVEYLVAYLEKPEQYQAEAEVAIQHINNCSACQKRVGYLIRALQTPAEDTLTCRECEELLPEYVQAGSEQQASATRWWPVTRHLATCFYCSTLYDDLLEMMALAQSELITMPQPPQSQQPQPNLSFLHSQKSKPEPAWQVDTLGRLVIQFSADLIRAWQPSVHGQAGLKADQPDKILYEYTLAETKADLAVNIAARSQRDNSTYCTILVEVNIPGRGGWPHLAGTEVILKHEETMLDTQFTDAFGQVIFEEIPVKALPQLRFEITPHPSQS